MKKLLVLLLIIFQIIIINTQNQTNNTTLNNATVKTVKNETQNINTKTQNQNETNNQNKKQNQNETNNQNKEQNQKLNQQTNQNQKNQINSNNSLNASQVQTNTTTKNDTNKDASEKILNLTQALKDFAKKLLDNLSNNTNNTNDENEKKMKEKKRQEEIKKTAEIIRMKQKEIQMNKTREEIKVQREECERHISNMVFSEILSLSIPGKNGEMLYQNITNVSKLSFSFYISDERKQIHLTFSGPNKMGRTTMIKSFRKKNCLFFEYDVTVPGQYSIFLNNYQNSEETELVFLMHLTNIKSDKLGTEKVDKISGYLQEIDKNMNNMRMTQGIINKKTNAHNDSVNKHNKQIVVYSIVEVVVLILIFITQSYYVKRLVSKL